MGKSEVRGSASALLAPLNGKSFRFVRACGRGEAVRMREENENVRWGSVWEEFLRRASRVPAIEPCVFTGVGWKGVVFSPGVFVFWL